MSRSTDLVQSGTEVWLHLPRLWQHGCVGSSACFLEVSFLIRHTRGDEIQTVSARAAFGASVHVVAVTDEVVGSNDDGVAEVLERLTVV